MADYSDIWFFNGTFYLVGYCHLRKEVRIFALDRIKMLNVTNESFTVPEDFDFEDMMQGSFGVVQGKPEKVRIRFAKEAAGYIQERIWHSSQRLFAQKDGSIIFEAAVAVNDELKNWILSWGSKARALEPPRLVEELRAEIRMMRDEYHAVTSRGQKAS